jgi:ComF family protein
MKKRDFLKRVLYYISVPKCVLCGEKLDYEDMGLCKKCMVEYIRHKQRNCPKCSKILSECSCSYKTLEAHGIKKFIKIFRYSKAEQSMPSNYLIYSLKQDNRSDVLSFLSMELATAIKCSIDVKPSEFVVTNVPRRKSAIVNYGYDHSKELARAVAKNLGIEYVDILKSKAKKAQKSVYGTERMLNAAFDYKCDEEFSLKGKSVILIDDIITTGSSISNSATLIRGLKPKRIISACLGTAYKEPYIDFEHRNR